MISLNMFSISRFIFGIIFLFSCNEKSLKQETKLDNQNARLTINAKSLAVGLLKDTLLYGNSLKILNFGNLDSTFNTCLNDKSNLMLFNTITSLIDSFDLVYNRLANSSNLFKENIYSDTIILVKLLRNIDSLNVLIRNNCSNYNTEFNGWKITCQFESKNIYNNISIENVIFYFDKNVTFIKKFTTSEELFDNAQSSFSKEVFERHIRYKALKL